MFDQALSHGIIFPFSISELTASARLPLLGNGDECVLLILSHISAPRIVTDESPHEHSPRLVRGTFSA
jgi:hypothetical protein